jgi:Aspartyl/Asparaginyl beta-hydroxylase
MSTLERGERYWWDGIESWYNHLDYIEAMNSWEKSLSYHVPKIVDEWDKNNNNNYCDDDYNIQNLTTWLEHLDTILQSCQNDPPDWMNHISIPILSRRLWFLSTCLLDANNVSKARKTLRQGIQLYCYFHHPSKQQGQLNKEKINIDNETKSFKPCTHIAAADEYSNILTSLFSELIMTYDEEAQTYIEDSVKQNYSSTLLEPTSDTLLLHSRTIVSWLIRHQLGPWRDPYQRPGYIYPSLTGLRVPFYPSNETKNNHYQIQQRNIPNWITALESQTTMIYQEYKSLLKHWNTWPRVGSGDHRDGSGSHDDRVLSGDWREYVLFGTGECQESLGCNHFPAMSKTKQWIANNIPDAVRLAQDGGGEIIVSVLRGSSHIRTHCGSTNIRWTAHLALDIPTQKDDDDDGHQQDERNTHDCRIRVADQWYTWKSGKVFVFDDSFEHEVILRPGTVGHHESLHCTNPNPNPTYRAVLLIRFWHPDLTTSKEQTSALIQIRRAKEMDTLRRYNPPLAPMTQGHYNSSSREHFSFSSVEDRGMELTHCFRCGNTGYKSLRLLRTFENHVPTLQFQCTCGSMLGI